VEGKQNKSDREQRKERRGNFIRVCVVGSLLVSLCGCLADNVDGYENDRSHFVSPCPSLSTLRSLPNSLTLSLAFSLTASLTHFPTPSLPPSLPPSGFPLTGKDQLFYNRFLANSAHAHGLTIALKNDIDQADSLADVFDFALSQ
jgi:hypothetical protein